MRSTLILPLALLPLLVASTAPTFAQERQGCFMINASGQLINLGEMCSEQSLGTGDIQVTLKWSTADDLDLAVTDPSGAQVWYQNPRVASSGELDVDANAGCQADTAVPIENVFWPETQAPMGDYSIAVNLYQRCGGTSGAVPFTITLLNKGNTQTLRGEVDDSDTPIEFPFSVSSQANSSSSQANSERPAP
ncbi:MAG: hypothetical protein HC781_09645 [Leptolyngbyaceae cyanobacterium CSU_1_4]|nr:hypothetical protein [Leptolyngbyaceae cyanobacterium CSU_1_4]